MKKNKRYLIPISILGLMGIVAYIIWQHLDSWLISIQTLPYGIKEFFMILLISMQILIAFIPGEPLELTAGYLFGPIEGTLICLVGSAIGTAIVYTLVNHFNTKIIYYMFTKEQILKANHLFQKRKTLIWVFILFLIPGTPKDVMTYLVCLMDITLGKWLILTSIGRIPSIVTSTFITGAIKNHNYPLACGVTIFTILFVITGSFLYKKISQHEK